MDNMFYFYDNLQGHFYLLIPAQLEISLINSLPPARNEIFSTREISRPPDREKFVFANYKEIS